MPRTPIKTLARLGVVCLPLCVTGGCISTTLTASIDCGSLIGQSLRSPTLPADPPADNTIGEIASFADRQTGQLEIAETKRQGVIEIVDGCHAEQERLTRKPWWRLF